MNMNPQVSSHGYGDANVFFVSGFPLKDDINSGLALSGSSERSLISSLQEVKLSIKQVYRSNLIKEQLDYSGTNANKLKAAIKLVNLEGYTCVLRDEIQSIKPNVVVPLDDIALAAVFPHVNDMSKPRGRKYWLDCYRGSVLKLRQDWPMHLPVKVIPTYGPQLLYSVPAARTYVRLDFQRIAKYSNSVLPVEEYGMRWVVRSARAFEAFIHRHISKSEWLNFDIETYGGMLTCISFCFDGFEACSVPLNDTTMPITERALLWRLTDRLLRHPIKKVNQNIKYDWTILERCGFVVENVKGDPMLAMGLLYPELPKGLDFSTSIYTPIPYYKDEGKEFNPKTQKRDRLYLYNAMDSISSHMIHTTQLKEMEENGTINLYHNEIIPLIRVYKNMDITGILVDESRKQFLLEKYERLYSGNLKILQSLVGNDKFNPRSWQQVGQLLYEELKYPKRTKTDPETGKLSYKTDKDTLDDLLINHGLNNTHGQVGYNIISRIIVCRKLSKVIEYISTPLHPGGRFCGTSNLAGTETGRSSFSKTIDEVWGDKKLTRLGRSLQTISKHGFHIDEEVFDDFEDASIAHDMRSMFVPTPGYVFIEGDGSQAEARAVAVLAEDWELLASFDQKPKIHAKTAAMIFGIPAEQITKDSPTIPKIGIAYYDLGKRIRHAGNYNMHGGRLAQMTHLTVKECNDMLEKFHATNPKIRHVFHYQVIEQVRRNRLLVTPFGRRRDFFGYLDDNLYKEALAQIPQSTISDQTKFTMPRIIDAMPGYMSEYRFLTEQHDGILAEVKIGRDMEYIEQFKKIYERPINFSKCSLSRDFNLTIPAEISMSPDNWMDLKEVG